MTPTELLAAPADDAQIVSAVRNGDLERYRELVQRHERLVFAVAWSRLGDAALAEEAAQEAFIRGYRRLWLLRDGAKFSGWIAAVTRRVALNLGVRHRRELNKRARWALEQPPHSGHAADEPAPTATPEMLRQGLAELPAAHRESLVLYYLEGKSGAEAAALLGISEIAFRARLHRARVALREQLEEKLAASLKELRPSASLAPSVMGAILATPSAKLAGGGIGAKILYALLPLKFLPVWIGAIAMLPGVMFTLALRRWDERNYRDAEGYRVRIHRRANSRMIWLVTPLFLLTWLIFYFLSPRLSWIQDLFLGVSLLSVPTLLLSARKLVIWPTRQGVTTVLSLALTVPGWLAIGLGWLPVSANSALMAVYLILFAIGFGSRPLRLDYSLFRRAVNDLPEADPAGRPSDESAVLMQKSQLLAFARFLGMRLLVADYVWSAQGLRLRLPALKNLLLFDWLGCSGLCPFTWPRLSTVTLAWNGTVSAHLGVKDEAALLASEDRDLPGAADLEKHVAAAVESAWRHFRAGEPALAERALGHAPDSEIFKVPPEHAWSTRVMRYFMLATATPIITLLALLYFWPALFTGLKPVNLTEPQVRAFLAGIQSNIMTGVEPANSPMVAISSPNGFSVLPPTNLFTPAALRTLKGSLGLYYGGSDLHPPGQRAGNPLRPFMNAWPVSRAIEGGWISWEDLGTTLEEVSAYVHRPGTDPSLFFRAGDLLVNEDSRSWGEDDHLTVQRISPFAPDVLRLLRDVNCLDLIPREQFVRQIASVQLLSGATKEGEPPIPDWRKMRGLFFTPSWPVLRDTYVSLAVLAILGGLDQIDRQACIDGILRLHRGKGFFFAPYLTNENEYGIRGDAKDTFYAFESLRILGGLDRVKDLDQWKFRPDERGWKSRPNWNDIEAWVCQQRLAKILAERKANPQAPVRSLRDP